MNKDRIKKRRYSLPDLKKFNFNVIEHQAKLENSDDFQNILKIEKEEI